MGLITDAYLNFLAAGLVVQVLGWLAISFAQGYLPASRVAISVLAQSVVTAILAALLLGEALTAWQLLGGVALLTNR